MHTILKPRAAAFSTSPHDPSDTENTQHYVIDGFILSPNVELVSVNTLDEGFTYSDHNPVKLQVKLSSEKIIIIHGRHADRCVVHTSKKEIFI